MCALTRPGIIAALPKSMSAVRLPFGSAATIRSPRTQIVPRSSGGEVPGKIQRAVRVVPSSKFQVPCSRSKFQVPTSKLNLEPGTWNLELAYFIGSSSSTFLAGLRCASSSLPTDQSKPRRDQIEIARVGDRVVVVAERRGEDLGLAVVGVRPGDDRFGRGFLAVLALAVCLPRASGWAVSSSLPVMLL